MDNIIPESKLLKLVKYLKSKERNNDLKKTYSKENDRKKTKSEKT